MTISLLLDGLLIGLLTATLVYAVVLNRRLAGLRKERESFEKMLAGFGAAMGRAEDSIHRLKSVADISSKDLQQQTSLARSLCDDLAFLADRGETAADRLDHAIRAGGDLRKVAKIPTKAAAPAAGRPATGQGAPKSIAESELIEALQSARQAAR